MQGRSEALPEALFAQRGWARRLARHLVRDAEADDLVQDAMLAGLRRPPTGDRPIRGWLATVLRHLARNRVLEGHRREAREQHAVEEPAHAPSAEDALAQVQIHKQLARLIEKLPAEDRRIIVLYYFEERRSADIGQLLNMPAATVRWRLARALDQLRAWLDEEAGGRRQRWMLALAPLLTRSRPVGAVATLCLAGAAIVALVVVGGFMRRDRPARSETARPTTVAPAAAAGGLPPATPGAGQPGSPEGTRPRPAVLSAAVPCPAALTQARAELEAVEQDLRQYEDPAESFELATPSPPVQATFTPLLAELLAPDAGGVLECRLGICRVLFLRPPDADWPQLRGKLQELPWRRALQDRLARVDAGKVGGITRDPLSGELQQKYALYLRLARPDGLPTSAPREPVPTDRATCERERVRVQELLTRLQPRRERVLPPAVRFARSSSANPTAAANARALLRRLAGQKAAAVDLECRGDVCRLRGDARASLPDLHDLSPQWTDRYSGLYAGPDGAQYFRIRVPRPRSPEENAREDLFRKLRTAAEAAIKACAERHTTEDRLDAFILFPGPGELNADGLAGRPSLRLRGPSADLSFGRCLREQLPTALASVPLLQDTPRREVSLSLRGTRTAP